MNTVTLKAAFTNTPIITWLKCCRQVRLLDSTLSTAMTWWLVALFLCRANAKELQTCAAAMADRVEDAQDHPPPESTGDWMQGWSPQYGIMFYQSCRDPSESYWYAPWRCCLCDAREPTGGVWEYRIRLAVENTLRAGRGCNACYWRAQRLRQ